MLMSASHGTAEWDHAMIDVAYIKTTIEQWESRAKGGGGLGRGEAGGESVVVIVTR